MSGLLPGQVLDGNRIELYKKRLANTSYFVTSPQMGMGSPIEVKVINRRKTPFGETAIPEIGDTLTRMQNPADEPPAPAGPVAAPPAAGGPSGLTPFGA